MADLVTHTVDAELISPEAFSPFGDVIGLGGRVEPQSDPRVTTPFSQWGEYELLTRDGEELQLDILTRTIIHPMRFTKMYRHHKATQAQAALGGKATIILVAPREVEFESLDDLQTVRAFIRDGSVAVNIGLSVWHEGSYPLVDRVDLVNLQGKHHPDDTEIFDLERQLGAVIEVRL